MMVYMDITTIRAKKTVVKELRDCEIHPRETNEDIIMRLIALYKNGVKAE